MRENRETPWPFRVERLGTGERKPKADKSHMHGSGESHAVVVPTKQPNKTTDVAAEVVEERTATKENMEQPNSCRTQSRVSEHNGLSRVREAAKKNKKARFTALLHHVTVPQLRDSYYSLKRQAAPGVDGVTWQKYGCDLEVHLKDLHERVHRGVYRAQPSRRVMIPKPDGRQRPLGVVATSNRKPPLRD